MAERVRVREISNDEGNRLLKTVRRSSGSIVTWRRAQIVLWSAQGMDVPQIAPLAFTSEDRVREVIHNFNADGFDSLYPKYAGGRPPKFTPEQRRGKVRTILALRSCDCGIQGPENLILTLAEQLRSRQVRYVIANLWDGDPPRVELHEEAHRRGLETHVLATSWGLSPALVPPRRSRSRPIISPSARLIRNACNAARASMRGSGAEFRLRRCRQGPTLNPL